MQSGGAEMLAGGLALVRLGLGTPGLLGVPLKGQCRCFCVFVSRSIQEIIRILLDSSEVIRILLDSSWDSSGFI